MATTISIINYKGGTGKTTTALNFGAALAKKKQKVLLLDFDSQCNLSLSKGFKKPDKHIGNILQKKASVEDSIYESDYLSIIPSIENLLDYEFAISNEPGREFIARARTNRRCFCTPSRRRRSSRSAPTGRFEATSSSSRGRTATCAAR